MQMGIEKQKKEREQQKQRLEEEHMVARLKEEMEIERQTFIQKRKQEREYLQHMIAKKDKAKEDAAKLREKERLDDQRAQDQYLRMIEIQEKDREKDYRLREERTQQYMN